MFVACFVALDCIFDFLGQIESVSSVFGSSKELPNELSSNFLGVVQSSKRYKLGEQDDFIFQGGGEVQMSSARPGRARPWWLPAHGRTKQAGGPQPGVSAMALPVTIPYTVQGQAPVSRHGVPATTRATGKLRSKSRGGGRRLGLGRASPDRSVPQCFSSTQL